MRESEKARRDGREGGRGDGGRGPWRIAYVTMEFPSPAEVFASNDVRSLAERGADVSVHALRPPHPRAAEMAAERGLERVRIRSNSAAATLGGLAAAAARPGSLVRLLGRLLGPGGPRGAQLARALALVPRAFGIAAQLERERPDVVHLYWSHYPSLVGLLVRERLPEAVLSISMAAYDLEMRFPPSAEVAAAADVVRTHAGVNLEAVEAFSGVPRSRVELIYNGVDLAKVRAARAGRTKTPARLVATGRLIPSKGMDEVLRAFARLRARRPDATLRILGDGPERGALERLAAELGVSGAVTFLGHVDHDRVLAECAEAEAFLLLSKKSSERLPNVVKEGMACGCLCVTTPTPGIEELLRDGIEGVIAEAHEHERIADALDAFLSDRAAGGERSRALIEAAERRIAQRFDHERNVGRFLEAWSEAAARRERDVPARGGVLALGGGR